jgi:hypothetical protein
MEKTSSLELVDPLVVIVLAIVLNAPKEMEIQIMICMLLKTHVTGLQLQLFTQLVTVPTVINLP